MHRFYEPSSSSMDSVGIEPLVDDRGELDELEQLKIMLRKATVEVQDIEGEYQGKKELQHSNNRIKNKIMKLLAWWLSHRSLESVVVGSIPTTIGFLHLFSTFFTKTNDIERF